MENVFPPPQKATKTDTLIENTIMLLIFHCCHQISHAGPLNPQRNYQFVFAAQYETCEIGNESVTNTVLAREAETRQPGSLVSELMANRLIHRH